MKVTRTDALGHATQFFLDDWGRTVQVIPPAGPGVTYTYDGAVASLQGNRLCVPDSSDVINRPLIKHTFTQVSSGLLEWQFDFDWDMTANEFGYLLYLQLGEGASMSDSSDHNGVGIDLRWGWLSGVNETLYYRDNAAGYSLGTLAGPHTFTVLADLDNDTYSVKVDGVTTGSDLPFRHAVNLDTIRFGASDLNEQMFAGRCFDNVSLSAVQQQGDNGIIDRVLASLQSAFTAAWNWLGFQTAAVRQAFAPSVALASSPAYRTYYFHNGSRVAMRVEGDPDSSKNGLFFFLHDQLGSTTVTLKRGGTGALTKVGELRYTPWGSNRDSGYASGDTPTDYRFTDQREDSYITQMG